LYKLKLNQLGLQAAQSVAVEGSDTTILHKEAEAGCQILLFQSAIFSPNCQMA
jgi:heterodisulfide reductase subunit A-like polyferredoxin